MDEDRQTRVLGIFAPVAPESDLFGLLREGVAFHRAGADIVDLDTTPVGPFASVEDDTVALLIRALREAGVPLSVTTLDASIAATAVSCGARWIIDPSGATADPRMIDVARGSNGTGWVVGPWSGNPVRTRDAADGVAHYLAGIERNLAALERAGVERDRLVIDASAGLSAGDPDPWRMLGDLDLLTALGCPVLMDGRDELVDSISLEDTADHRDDAAVGLAVLAVSSGAWGIRTRSVGRVAASLQRIQEPAGMREPIG